MANILFITTIYRTGEKVYPILPRLSKSHNIDVLNLVQMSQNTVHIDDPRQPFYDMCNRLNIKMIDGPPMAKDKSESNDIYKIFMQELDDILKRNYYHVAIFDNNITQKGVGLSHLYLWCNKQRIPVIGSPHGNREFRGYRVLDRVGRMYDYSFVLGKKEKDNLIKHGKKKKHYGDRLLPAGIPSNDILKKYKRGNKYILVIPNYTIKPPKYGKTGGFHPFTKESFDKMELAKLSEEYDCPIVIKEKVRLYYQENSLEESLEEYKSIIDFVSLCDDDNKLIADAKIVISAPSTLAFKPIQMGIPTILLKRHGMGGNFLDYPHVIHEDCNVLRRAILEQIDIGRNKGFIKNTLKGGWKFKSAKRYVNYINRVLQDV
jgi:hypothetical protein